MESLGINKKFWQGKRVFLTGHTGFKGSWLSLWLQLLGAKVTGFALPPPTNPNLFNVAKVVDGMDSIIGDIRDIEVLKKAMQRSEPEIVIHMAAQPLVRYSYHSPVETYSTNLMGSVNLLQAILNNKGIKAVINITSDKCYENHEWIWSYRENDVLGGYDPYSNSKACAELVTAAYRSSFFNPANYEKHGVAIATARAGNVIGGGDWAPDRLIPDFIRAIYSGKTFVARNPNAIRPWQHVLEPLKGYLTLAEKLYSKGAYFGEAWNFGPNNSDAKSVEWIIHQLSENFDNSVSYDVDISSADFHEANFLKLDCSKARAKLGWKPSWDVSEAIRRVCLWHNAHLRSQDMKEYTLNEIEEYQRLTSIN